MNNLDLELKDIFKLVTSHGVITDGRTSERRIRFIRGREIVTDMREGEFNIFKLRKNNPYIAFAETYGFLCGATNVDELMQVHPALKLWESWADDNGELGGVYGTAFKERYLDMVYRIIRDPLSTHHRMTTLIPEKFPIPGNTYHQNVEAGRFSLMPCLHSYHFLSDGNELVLHATQASGDLGVGVIPHNTYQTQFLMMLTAELTGLKMGSILHKIDDIHVYENQLDSLNEVVTRSCINIRSTTKYKWNEHNLDVKILRPIKDIITFNEFDTHSRVDVPVDS